jgi:putative RNA 2'-phosphotransferase
MNEKQMVQLSKQLSYVLRHNPASIGLQLDAGGWCDIEELIVKLTASLGLTVTRVELDQVVEENNKKRFAISEDNTRIRASQGHSITVDLGYIPKTPPDVLYHGTAKQNLESIMKNGLVPGSRHDVHMSKDVETAKNVGTRHGKPVVLEVDAKSMHKAGVEFFESENGVWLTKHVPSEFLKVID